MEEKKIQLGFVEKPEEGHQWSFVDSKVGGKPVWLIPHDIPTTTAISCGRCEEPMSFLLQIYAPLSTVPEAYHRVLYVFCCKKFTCMKYCPLGSFKVLRSQLPNNNPHYTPKESYDGVHYVPQFKGPNVCAVSGLGAPMKCSGCKSAYYASKKHQLYHWNLGTHKKFCKQTQLIDPNSKGAMDKLAELLEDHHLMDEGTRYPCNFLEFEIVTEPAISSRQSNPPDELEVDENGSGDEDEDEEEEEKTKQNNLKIIEHYKKKTRNYDNAEFNTNDWIVSDAQKDVYFHNFKKHIKEEPEQILRYYEDNTTKPLWISVHNKPSAAADIPNCSYCGSERICEFQVMPELLNHLEEESSSDEPIDFGTLVVYTCKNSCSNDGGSNSTPKPYKEEFLWVQQISAGVHPSPPSATTNADTSSPNDETEAEAEAEEGEEEKV